MLYTFHSERWFPCRIELVFAFFANPQNLPRLMPAWQAARIEEAAYAPPPPRPLTADPALRLDTLAAGVGSRIILSMRPFLYSPIRVPWEAEIAEFVWNEYLCDIQIRGPFSYWRHYHRLHPETRTDDSGAPIEGTLLRDDIEYSLPYGPIGSLIQSFVVKPQLKATFNTRQQRTHQLLQMIFATR
jgi:ligand-binding SRPBCC domain-containing protein